jgi:putative transposase
MPSTHTSLHYHFTFSTKERRALIVRAWRDRLHAYVAGIVRALGGVPEAVGGTADHIHILASLKASDSVVDVMRKIKASSSGWVHRTIGAPLFAWQDGYGAFTAGQSEIERLRNYIHGQEEHHRCRSFEEEYLDLLRQCGVEFDERFLW